jgi:hypothetical protein
MKRLWTFGDSFTEGYNEKHEWSKNYIKWKGYTPKVYGEVIADRLDIDLKNIGQGGSDNYTILERVCENVDKIKDDDLIIIGWSSPIRFRLVGEDKKTWCSIIPIFDNKIDNFGKMISQSTLDEIFVNRDTELYQMEIINWIKLLNKTFKSNTIIHWTHNRKMHGTNLWNFSKFNKIKNETNDDINDNHYSEFGHLQLADELISIIDNKITNKKFI